MEEFIDALPPPKPFNTWYNKLENLLETHPNSILGEVGLDNESAATEVCVEIFVDEALAGGGGELR